jgi:hypothetical protein
MTLLVNEIITSVYQAITPNKNKIIAVIRPHLYIKNRPIGTVKVQLMTADRTIINESLPITISTITASNEYHGYVTFYIDAFLKKDVTYLVNVVCEGGYTFSNSAYCGVCNDYDLRKYKTQSPIKHQRNAPLDLEVWTLSQK